MLQYQVDNTIRSLTYQNRSSLYTWCHYSIFTTNNILVQTTPASSLWRQLCTPMVLLEHWYKDSSVPRHATSSNQIGPLPWPNWALSVYKKFNIPKTIVSTTHPLLSSIKSQLSADHISILYVPMIITDSTPGTIEEHLYTTWHAAVAVPY